MISFAEFTDRDTGFVPHLGAASHTAMRTVFQAALAEPLTGEQSSIFHARCGDRKPPAAAVSELIIVGGRSIAKSEFSGAMAAYFATCRAWPTTPGQTPLVMILARDQDMARVEFNYVLGQLQASPTLSAEIKSVTKQRIELRNGVVIEVGTSDYRAVRGYSIALCICSELAFWPITAESANPDRETLAAVRPGLARFRGSLLICISSPYAQQGELYELHRQFFGVDNKRVLVAHGATLDFNPTFPRYIVEEALQRDPASASAEYLAIFRSDVAAFIDAALVDGNTRAEPRELPRMSATPDGAEVRYAAGIDVSGGRGDAAAACVAHIEGSRVVIDALRRWPSPHNPSEVARAIAEFLFCYGLREGFADAYAAEFARQAYAAAGVTLLPAPGTRSECYLHLLPRLAQGAIELPPDPVLRIELLGLERRVGRAGKDSVNHRSGGRDDSSNALALASWCASRNAPSPGDQLYVVRSTINSGLEDFDRHAVPLSEGIGHILAGDRWR